MRAQKLVHFSRLRIKAHNSNVKSLTRKEAIEEMAPGRLAKKQQALAVPRKKIVARWQPWQNPVYSHAMTLANLLFPRKFPKIIAAGKEKGGLGQPVTTYSEQIPLTRESQKAINDFYTKGGMESQTYQRYDKRYGNKIFSEYQKFEKIGMNVNVIPVNAGIGKQGIVYFEVMTIKLPKMRQFVEALPENTKAQKLKKKQAIALLLALSPFQGINGTVDTHLPLD